VLSVLAEPTFSWFHFFSRFFPHADELTLTISPLLDLFLLAAGKSSLFCSCLNFAFLYCHGSCRRVQSTWLCLVLLRIPVVKRVLTISSFFVVYSFVLSLAAAVVGLLFSLFFFHFSRRCYLSYPWATYVLVSLD